jgi:hypothetical protein
MVPNFGTLCRPALVKFLELHFWSDYQRPFKKKKPPQKTLDGASIATQLGDTSCNSDVAIIGSYRVIHNAIYHNAATSNTAAARSDPSRPGPGTTIILHAFYHSISKDGMRSGRSIF